MRQPRAVISSTMLLVAFAATGCGGSSTTKPALATAAARVVFTSSAVVAHSLPARYTCDGKDIHPPLEWGAVPAGTRELLLLAVGLEPTGTGYYSSSVQWALAGVKPGLHRLAAGEEPPGTLVGLDSSGNAASYSVCPKKGVREQYEFILLAVPTAIKVRPRFPALSALAGLTRRGTAASAVGKGAFLASYRRR
jgi:hypothetical protein